uniref:G-protein coupled receptors family 1 profile domain-containing protein n=1 Tax=Panagrolaimus sp. PS1159 TaxID=55785 RepID=A0AC35EZ20_9BILA
MYSTISFCILSIPLEIYYYFVWPDEKSMNPYWVWWAGMIQSMTLMAIPITVLFLSIDRCLIIALPNSECKRKPFIIGLTIVSILVACGVSLWYDDLEPYIKIPEKFAELSICRDFTCLLQRASFTVYLVIKLFITFAIVIGFTINLNEILGPYRTALGALDAGVCAFSYYKVISRKMNATKTTPLGTSKREASVYKIVNAIKKNNWVNSTVNQ